MGMFLLLPFFWTAAQNELKGGKTECRKRTRFEPRMRRFIGSVYTSAAKFNSATGWTLKSSRGMDLIIDVRVFIAPNLNP